MRSENSIEDAGCVLASIRRLVRGKIAVIRDLTTREDYEDIVSEVAARVYSPRDRYSNVTGTELQRLLAVIVRSVVIDFIRRACRSKRVAPGGCSSLDADVDPDVVDGDLVGDRIADLGALTPERVTTERAIDERLALLGGRLTTRQRAILAGLVRGNRRAEIAGDVSVSRSTLHREITRIRSLLHDDQLRELLDGDETHRGALSLSKVDG